MVLFTETLYDTILSSLCRAKKNRRIPPLADPGQDPNRDCQKFGFQVHGLVGYTIILLNRANNDLRQILANSSEVLSH